MSKQTFEGYRVVEDTTAGGLSARVSKLVAEDGWEPFGSLVVTTDGGSGQRLYAQAVVQRREALRPRTRQRAAVLAPPLTTAPTITAEGGAA